jgi:small subunit ribosomal protein S14|uniref:Small ribosomal subunit protein uS14c n=2 Tax=Tetradesmus obliquus TaxID=3088 RepID=RR14_TETOB|nr:ribosomal protein S14 [Tetradesmus obliquus]Q1KVT9.1 RecName: Full=Small ribosomal subunit protein uS14c; AltName: Full=30S ribosomal protein S14, chloroplastic [Tetradesmus obliquus]ABD48268.1 ribosomal protein S14 [Tetradesmus obliquus]ASY96112.1 30S ribosomal protein S14 [Tetradesmus obliquus]WVD55808.1 ribosomal protein S14 [Tetradesmus distendus]|eukprot:GHRQ01000006.1.p2 GENE.GHRQ01000006.1~~GHRQ01000006.1.p2  ORF type:complete len:101 (+),score=1.99 GHRQ01000006.1:1707-2009(+)
MANKAMIQRELKRQNLVMKFAKKRAILKQQIQQASSLKEKLALHRKLQQLPRNSSPVRLHNRCLVTGRPKGYFRDFGLSRHVLREMAHEGLLPGVRKASW